MEWILLCLRSMEARTYLRRFFWQMFPNRKQGIGCSAAKRIDRPQRMRPHICVGFHIQSKARTRRRLIRGGRFVLTQTRGWRRLDDELSFDRVETATGFMRSP